MIFYKSQISLVKSSFDAAEEMVRDYFRLQDRELRSSRYDIKTLVELAEPEVNKSAFAHICRYECEKPEKKANSNYYVYRICLQDDRILDAVDRGRTSSNCRPFSCTSPATSWCMSSASAGEKAISRRLRKSG